jgi:hypothetical protein
VSQNNDLIAKILCEKCQGMTQLKGQINSNLKKIRQKTLRKFLLFCWAEIEAEDLGISRRTKYDYKLARETFGLIDKYITDFIEAHGIAKEMEERKVNE